MSDASKTQETLRKEAICAQISEYLGHLVQSTQLGNSEEVRVFLPARKDETIHRQPRAATRGCGGAFRE